jgi:myosin heavy subunit
MSVLLEQVQESISAAAAVKRSENASNNSTSASSILPSKRGRAFITSDDILGDDIINSSTSSKLSITESRRQQAELADARLRSQEDRERLKFESDERQSERSRYRRQLEFLEAELNTARRALAEKSEAFEAERVALQEKVRKLEAKLVSTTSSSQSSINHAKEVDSAALAQALASSDAKWRARLEQLDAVVRSKSEEVVAVKKLNAVLEDRCTQLEQQVLNLSADAVSAPSSEGGGNSRDLANKVANLESSLREKSRALERMERKLQNQQVLAQENESLKSKLSALKESSNAVASTQEALQRATSEREEWESLFRDLIKNDISGYAKSTKIADNDHEIPIHALRMLKRTQETAAVQAKAAAEFETSLVATKRRLAQVEAKLLTLESEAVEAKLSQEKNAVQIKLLAQQTQLYEKEVFSLRDLLKSFDAEFSIGRPDGAVMLRAKDDMIGSLRSQLDHARAEARVSLQRLQELEVNKAPSASQSQQVGAKAPESETTKTDAPAPAQPQPEIMSAGEGRNYEALIASLRDEIDKLKYRLHGFQIEFGADYISSETRVFLCASI